MSGVKESHKPEGYFTMPFGALREVSKVYKYGASKYGPYNYLNGYAYSLSIDALFRHLIAWLDPEDSDTDESGFSHLAHAAWHVLHLLEMELRKDIAMYGDHDDRQGTPQAHVLRYYEADGFHEAGR